MNAATPMTQPREQNANPNQQRRTQATFERWFCRKLGCNRILLEYSPNTTGVLIKICDKCGTENRLEDGEPRR